MQQAGQRFVYVDKDVFANRDHSRRIKYCSRSVESVESDADNGRIPCAVYDARRKCTEVYNDNDACKFRYKNTVCEVPYYYLEPTRNGNFEYHDQLCRIKKGRMEGRMLSRAYSIPFYHKLYMFYFVSS